MKTSVIRIAPLGFLIGWCFFCNSAAGAELWVAPGGNDRNAGTREHPFSTVSRALQKAGELKLTSPGHFQPVRIFLRGGIYPLRSPLSVPVALSGSSDSPMLIAAAPGETPILSGGVRVDGWKPAGRVRGLPEIARGKVWVAPAPKSEGKYLEFRQLWVDGAKAIRAREPNGESLSRLVAWDKTNQIATFSAAALAGVTDPARLEMVLDQVWEIAVLRLNSIRVEGANALVTFRQPESEIEFNHPWPPVTVNKTYQAPFFMVNAIQFLDSPGEWFEDLKAGKIYYWPRANEDLKRAIVFAPVLETVVNIQGSLDNRVENIQFKGITFSHTAWLRPSRQGHVPLQATMAMLAAKKLSPKGTPYHSGLDNLAWIERSPGAVTIKNARRISFENCVFDHLAGAGLDVQSGTQNDNFEGCLFHDIGGNGIQLGKFSDTNVETHVPYNPADEREFCIDERIANSLVTDCANEDWGGVGIIAGYARGIKIEHNEVSNCSYTGISVGWGWTKMTNAMRDNFIHANHIHHIATRMGDTAGIYTLSVQPGTMVSENYVHDIKMSPYVPDPEHWFYLYLDEGSSFITVRDNWCPSEKFMKNANGPGNVWENNGPQVSEEIRAAAGLQPQFQDLLHRTDPR